MRYSAWTPPHRFRNYAIPRRYRKRDGKIVAVGGRVLNVTATGRDVAEAQARAYDAVSRIHWEGSFHRRDIGWRALKR